jgi:hemoglobin
MAVPAIEKLLNDYFWTIIGTKSGTGMTKDIKNRQDIELLINSFYDKVRQDKTIGFIFNDTIGADWSHHLPKMHQFWDMVLFSTPGYAGNPTNVHVALNKHIPLMKEHFDRWLELWNETVDALFAGENADQAKNRAMLMSNLIHIKVQMSKDGNFIQ